MMTLAVLGPLIVTGALFFWRTKMVRGAPTALTCLFVGFRTDFVTSVRVSRCFRRSFGPRGSSAHGGLKTPRGDAHLLSPWLRP